MLSLAAIGVLLLGACGGTGGTGAPPTAANPGASGNGGATAPGVTADAIQLGTTTPLTSAVAAVCAGAVNGALAYFASVNEKGGVYGRKIVDTVLDDGYTAPRGIANVKTFMEKPIFAQYGGCGAIQAAAIWPILQDAGIPYLFGSGLTEMKKPVKKYIFTAQASYGDDARATITWAFKKDGPGSVYLINYVLASYEEVTAVVPEVTKALGGTFLGETIVTASVVDYTPIALKIRELKPDYIVIQIPATQAAAAVNAMSEQHALPNRRILALEGTSHQFVDNIKDPAAANMSMAAFTGVDPKDPKGAECRDLIKKYDPTLAESAVLDAVSSCGVSQIFVAALQKAGPNLTRDGLVTALESINKQSFGILAPVSFSSTSHDAFGDLLIGLWQNGNVIFQAP
jgi:branched-chain amino acid transport system substrate-binding protein